MNSFNSDEGPGYVYVVRWGQTLYKIGITKNIEQRFQQLKVGDKLVPIWWGFFAERRAVENEMHKTLDRYRLPQSDYFELNRDQVDYLLADLKARTFQSAGDQYKELIPNDFRPGYIEPVEVKTWWDKPVVEQPQVEQPESSWWEDAQRVADLLAIEPEVEPEWKPELTNYQKTIREILAEAETKVEPELSPYEKRVQEIIAEKRAIRTSSEKRETAFAQAVNYLAGRDQ